MDIISFFTFLFVCIYISADEFWYLYIIIDILNNFYSTASEVEKAELILETTKQNLESTQ